MVEQVAPSGLRPQRLISMAVIVAAMFVAFALLAVRLSRSPHGSRSNVSPKTATGVDVVGVFDDFRRPNNSRELGVADNGAVWRALTGTWGVRGDQAYVSAPSSPRSMSVVGMGGPDGSVRVTASVVEPACGLVVRFHDRLNYVAVVAVPKYATWNVVEVVGGKEATLGNLGVSAVSNGAILSIRLDGTTVSVSVDNAPPKSFTVHELPGSNSVGFLATGPRAGDARWDAFVATPTPAGTTSSAPPPAAPTTTVKK